MKCKFERRLFCGITAFLLAFVFLLETPHAEAAEARASYDWSYRIKKFQRVNASYTNKRPALTMIVQNFLSLANTTWANKIVNAGGMDGYFGTATLECVKDYQFLRGLTDDGDVWENTWWQIGCDLFDIGPTGGYFFFTYSNGPVLRALNSSPYTFYYPTFNGGDIQWNILPKYQN